MTTRMSIAPGAVGVSPVELLQEISEVSKKTLAEFQDIWTVAGYQQIECQSLLGDFLAKYKNLCKVELDAEKQILEHAKQQVANKFAMYVTQCEKLHRAPPADCEDMGSNYADKLAELERRMAAIQEEITHRKGVILTELQKIEQVAHELGEPLDTHLTKSNALPELSDLRLESLGDVLLTLNAMRNQRASELQEVAEDCVKMLRDLVVFEEGTQSLPDAVKYADIDSMLMKVVNASGGSSWMWPGGLHRRDLDRLISRAQGLASEKEKRRDELATTGADIARLWTLLRVPTSEREAFQSSFKMNLSMSTVTRGREELKRLKELRTKSLARVIDGIREEMRAHWFEMGVTEREQQVAEFPLYGVPVAELEDAAVEQHEDFCQRLKSRVEEMRPLLARVSRREAVVEERMELEVLMMNPERLTARGPKAREDRKREEEMQRRVKSLDKITKELMSLIASWEEVNGPFIYKGVRYVELAAEQEAAYEAYIETKRNARKKKDGSDGAAMAAASAASMRGLLKKMSSTAPAGACSTPVLAATPTKSSLFSTAEKPTATQSSQKNIFQQHQHQVADQENRDRNSRDSVTSDITEFTSATEIKERPSTMTVLKSQSSNTMY